MPSLYLACYAGLAIFAVAVVARALRLARLPLHLRWELYPVAHEKGRAHYGGSFMEEPEFWTKPRETSRLGELKVMLPEILLLEGVRERNPSQWIRTLPFHLGLYLTVAATVLMIVGGIFGATAPGGFFGATIPILGYAGFGLGLIGALSLFVRRWRNPEYREYTNPVDFLNLGLFVAAFAVAILAQILADPSFVGMRGFFAGLFSFAPHGLAPVQGVEVVLFALLTAYVPLTHMSHFFTKYFMYHDIRWSDEPLKVGGRIEQKMGKSLAFTPTWAGKHIQGDGKKTWVDVATSTGLPESEKGGDA